MPNNPEGRSKTVKMIATQGMIAAIYVALALLLQPISFGNLQCRVSEALTVLPFLSPITTVGLTVGCLISNIIGGAGILDIVFGTLATLVSGLLTARMPNKWLAPLPPVLINAVVVGAVLSFVSVPLASFFPTFWIFAAEVGLGQVGACYVLGIPLLAVVRRTRLFDR
ncbi:MAG: QueT transporter family protein [Eubacteriales bacterium]|nr:QueT transporter family protein [Eubacteriales bacterium]